MEQYDNFTKTNCFAAKGAFELDQTDEYMDGPEDCARKCDEDRVRHGFAFMTGNLPGGKCWRRSHIQLLLCEQYDDHMDVEFTMYVNRRLA
mmetsp:Transcript_122057/g.341650  ORF Transcript_122057/g.341650 Transcript_122057/m.341650 type:complete len:91 (+) Transcript_122057:203-475(+)